MTGRHDNAGSRRDTRICLGLLARGVLLKPSTHAANGTQWRTLDMTDEHTRGAISKAKGTVEEGLGKLTGNKEQELHGKAKQVQGSGQEVLGDIQDAVRKPKDKDEDKA